MSVGTRPAAVEQGVAQATYLESDLRKTSGTRRRDQDVTVTGTSVQHATSSRVSYRDVLAIALCPQSDLSVTATARLGSETTRLERINQDHYNAKGDLASCLRKTYHLLLPSGRTTAARYYANPLPRCRIPPWMFPLQSRGLLVWRVQLV